MLDEQRQDQGKSAVAGRDRNPTGFGTVETCDGAQNELEIDREKGQDCHGVLNDVTPRETAVFVYDMETSPLRLEQRSATFNKLSEKCDGAVAVNQLQGGEPPSEEPTYESSTGSSTHLKVTQNEAGDVTLCISECKGENAK
ncbi:hypothetical protein EVAR_6030_1 [Eumeta japonica]|uniref:Uncharacterized protein n=1 Tax=Eumeta variegata TaxID=151549 RepID=A0A4C1T9K6_EUMVA|nr:hypothetical protein EVAR_6030_1 [Eumeta japonica]